MHEGVNLATFFVGQMVIAFGHMSSVRCGVPREDSLHLAGQGPACTTWKSVAAEKDGLKGARYVRIAAGDLRPCPRPFPQPLCSAMSSMHRYCTSELKRRVNAKRDDQRRTLFFAFNYSNDGNDGSIRVKGVNSDGTKLDARDACTPVGGDTERRSAAPRR